MRGIPFLRCPKPGSFTFEIYRAQKKKEVVNRVRTWYNTTRRYTKTLLLIWYAMLFTWFLFLLHVF